MGPKGLSPALVWEERQVCRPLANLKMSRSQAGNIWETECKQMSEKDKRTWIRVQPPISVWWGFWNIQVGCSLGSSSTQIQIIKPHFFFFSHCLKHLLEAVNVVNNVCSIVPGFIFDPLSARLSWDSLHTMFLLQQVTIYIISCYSFVIVWATKYASVLLLTHITQAVSHCCTLCLIWIAMSDALFVSKISSKHLSHQKTKDWHPTAYECSLGDTVLKSN